MAASLCLSLYALDNKGLHLTSHGIEFDERVDVFGSFGSVRAAVEVDFPTEFPLKNDRPPVNLRINRLSLVIPTP